MSAELITALALLVTALASLAGVIIGIRNQREIKVIHLSINSRMDELLAATRSGSHAAGLKQGREETKGD